MDYVQISGNSEDGFQDLKFNILNCHQDTHKNYVIRALGKFSDINVGFDVAFNPDIRPGAAEGRFDDMEFNPGGIAILSVGMESDKFVQALADLYNQKYENHQMAEKTEFTCIALEGNPQNFGAEDLKFKIFHDDYNKKGLYSELYINVLISKGVLEIKEKDIDYRENIYRALVGDQPNFLERLYKKTFRKI